VTDNLFEGLLGILFLILISPALFQLMSVTTDQIRGDYIEESKHEDIVGSLESEISTLESNNSELRTDNQHLDQVISNYSENRSDLRQERNYYEELSENLSEDNEALEDDNEQLEDELDRVVPIWNIFNYNIQVWDVEIKVVYVFSFSVVFVFTATFTLVEINLIGLKEGKISLEEIYNKLKKTLNKISDTYYEIWSRFRKSLEEDSEIEDSSKSKKQE